MENKNTMPPPENPAYTAAPPGEPPYPAAPPPYPEQSYPAGYQQAPFQTPPPPYSQGYNAKPCQKTVLLQHGAENPNSYLVLSCIVYWCCNCVMGTIAFGLSMASKSSADENDIDGARRYGRAAMWVSITGIICTVLACIIIISLHATAAAALMYQMDKFNGTSHSGFENF